MIDTVRAHARARPVNKWVTFVVVAISVFMATLDGSIVNIALPTVAAYFHTGISGEIEWVVIAYLVVIAALLLSIGRLSDVVGRKAILFCGVAIFTCGSALCGAAQSLPMLILSRALQGIGAAQMMAVTPAILTGAFAPAERGRALGLNALVVAMGTSVGPTLGGVITQQTSWRWIFFVNLPVGAVALLGIALLLQDTVERRPLRLDLAGTFGVGISLASLTLGLSFGQEWGWTSARLVWTLGVALVAVVLTALLESRAPDPLIDVSLLRRRVFASANASLVLSFLALFAVSFVMPFYLEELRGYSAQDAGFLLTPLPLTIAVVAPFAGALADRIGTRWLAAGGLTIACSGLLLLAELSATATAWDVVWRLVVIGLGQGLFQSPNNSALMGAAPRQQQGLAAGFMATGRVVGQSMSVALAGVVLGAYGSTSAGAMLARLREVPPSPRQLAPLENTFLTGFHAAFVVCACVAACGILTSLVRGQDHRAGKA